MDKTFGGNLKWIRESLNLTQTDVSLLTGLAPAVISFYETGSRSPGIENIVIICKALNCTPNDLITIDSRNTK